VHSLIYLTSGVSVEQLAYLQNFWTPKAKQSIDAFLQRMLHNSQDINEDEFIDIEKILVATTIYKLNNKWGASHHY
jgi:hypothetical protein